jgi:hypothetical protein
MSQLDQSDVSVRQRLAETVFDDPCLQDQSTSGPEAEAWAMSSASL